ncbi:hypothetical protein FOPG_18761 [Fusarium oxysporum f. sp. conglutinans race 2 54008]|uniref:Uncharacterized protein n=1 Tax=Fusarium oxysporum f. sp. conglutinans race 2 54008 TaxID=1089457 RepID=X0GMZ1_FUSOX|nr:hypothetical protein FOPG_18761 [Fusarium oxysporum f. sp. conglutinans race 2 54008]
MASTNTTDFITEKILIIAHVIALTQDDVLVSKSG